MRVLVTDGDTRSALAATRSLGRQGHEVIVAADRKTTLAASSRYCRQRLVYQNPSADPNGFIEFVHQACHDLKVDVLLPMTEVTTLLLTEARSGLPAFAQLPFSDATSIADASDKAGILRAAAECGVGIPRTTLLLRAEDARLFAHELSYPAVIKPARSRIRTSAGYLSTGVTYARDPDDLVVRVTREPPEIFPLLLQERIEGPGVGLFACYDRGRPIAWFAHRRIREKPPSGGVSVMRESTALDPAAVASADRLLRALNWHGVAMVEFKRDMRDGTLRLMEINARFWGSLQLAIDAGVDFPALLVDLASGKHPAPVADYKVGIRTRWFWGDVDALLTLLFRSRSRLNLPPSHPGRLRTLWDFLRFWDPRCREEIFRLEDPAPFLLETRRWLMGR